MAVPEAAGGGLPGMRHRASPPQVVAFLENLWGTHRDSKTSTYLNNPQGNLPEAIQGI